ncbi:TPA: hypothetical protein HOO63_14450 [Escherichia coli]|nr:hypothetical protein [Escherichia coli]EFI8347783.1 hypothetical protein [Escherichia coli]OTC33687.1 hypothetical protein AW075_23745 [Escherichia coli]OWD37981.1 hypothetical protein A8C67_24035 [Escherichia coli]RCQ37875.1 hypothetical protein APT10_18355 [Escherichia coli]
MLLAENPRQGMMTEARVVIRILIISDHINRQDNTQIQTIMRIIYIYFLQKLKIHNKTKYIQRLQRHAC